MTEPLHDRLNTLRQVISDMQSVLVAFSGGIDSTVVLKIAMNNSVNMRWPTYLFQDITSLAPGESHRINSG